MARELRERKDIPENYKWNLEAIYSDDSLWEEDYNKVAPLLEKIKTYEGRLTESADTLYEALALINELERIVSKLGSYAHMHNDEDTSVGVDTEEIKNGAFGAGIRSDELYKA